MRAEDSGRAEADDPLAELTRLIESFDAPDSSRTVVNLASRRPAAAQRPTGQAQEPHLPAAPMVEPDSEDDVLRGSLEEIADEIHEGHDETFDNHLEEDPAAASEQLIGMSPRAAAEPPRRRWLLRSVALIALGAGGLGYYFYSHGGLPGVAKAPPPTIMASTAPVKVPPPTSDSGETADDAAPLLRKGQQPSPAAAKVVDGTEQPVDVKAQLAVQPPPAPAPALPADGPKVVQNAPGTVALAPAAAPSAEAAPAAAASPVPPAASPSPAASTALQPLAAAPNRALGATAQPSPLAVAAAPALSAAAPAAAIANPPAPQFPAPTKQRSVVIRPDGSLVADAKPDAAPAPAPTLSPAKAAADGSAAQAAAGSTPKPDLPTKLNGKSQERVSSSKPVGAAPAGAAGAPMQLGPAGTDKTASAAPAPSAVAAKPAAPTDVTPAAPDADVVATTPSNPSADAETKAGGWAAQLGAPRSQGEADATIAKLQAKYADALDGASLSIHKAEVNGDTVYRVRAVGLTKDAAAAICSKVHAAGGGCFLARN